MITMKRIFYLMVVMVTWFSPASDAQTFNRLKHFDTSLPLDERVNSPVSMMTPEEKISQLLYTAPAIERLGVPAYNWWNECLHGVARAGYATVFPQSITLAGSWDKELVKEVATLISDEARAKYNGWISRGKRGIYQGLTFWSPNINIFRDPRWGRGHETYGEDPYLTGQLGLRFVQGLLGDDPAYLKAVATAKHFAVHSGPEPLRHEFDANCSDRDLYETYLPAFRTLVVDGKVWSVMGAYNRFRGYPCCASPELYNILREDWGFDGYIVSDCGAINDFFMKHRFSKDRAEASAAAVKTGTDLECGNVYANLGEALKRDIIGEADLDVAVKRLFTARFKLGMFDPDSMVPFSRIPPSANATDLNGTLARKAAEKSIILLKNKNHLLPLKKGIGTIAVIGPNADNPEALLGNYNGIPRHPVTILKGLKDRLEPETKVLYAEGCHLADGIHNLVPVPSCYLMTAEGKQGVTGEYFSNAELKGEPAFVRTDPNIDFYWESESPGAILPDDDFSIRWTGYLCPPVTGNYALGSWGMPTLNVWLEGEKILSYNTEHHAFHKEKEKYLEAGKKYKIVYEYRNWYGDGDARFLWSVPDTGMKKRALEAAEKADVVVLVLGLSQRLEGEEMPIRVDGFLGGDRTHLNLPKPQEELMEAIKATGKPLVVVLMNGSALSVNRVDEIADAILSAGYPGQEGGHAVADILFGDTNPAGRLPVTYYRSVDQLPPFEEYDMKGRTYRYFTGEPLYPFGFGLSYTSFGYSDLKMPEQIVAGDSLTVSVKVTNTGKRSGDEVVQLYLTDEKASTPRPIRQLEGFERITLNPGETKEVKFILNPRQLSMINHQNNRVIEPGWFTLSVGGKQPGFKGNADASTTEVLTGRFRVKGKELRFESR